MNKLQRVFGAAWVILATGGMLACSAPRGPAQEVEKAELAVRTADDGGASDAAALEMRMARDKLERAKGALRAENYELAERLGEQAAVDAELANVKAESESARTAAVELENAIRSLRSEAQRGAAQTVPQ